MPAHADPEPHRFEVVNTSTPTHEQPDLLKRYRIHADVTDMLATRFILVGLVAVGLVTSSCSSTARDTLADVYENEPPATVPVEVEPRQSEPVDRAGADTTGQNATIGQNVIDRIDEAGDATCATDKQQIETTLEIHYQLNGFEATTISDLKQYGVDDELNRWTLEVPADGSSTAPSVVPVVGGSCDT